jgi:subtilisin family serine protease
VDKIDPRLRDLMDALAAGELPFDPDNPNSVMHVYVIAEGDDFGGMSAAGFDVASPLGNTAIVTLPISSIEDLAARPDVLAIFAPRAGVPRQGPAFVPTMGQSNMRLREGWDVTSSTRPNGSRGADVIVGIVDTGVNILHDAFTRDVVVGGAHVRQTRILSYWAQGNATAPGTTPLWQRNGQVFTEDAINNHIAAFVAAGTLPPAALRDDDGHGTGAASVAAGATWSAEPHLIATRLGVAPEAQLVVASVTGDPNNFTRDALAGIEFCFETARALGRPCVVNMSLGSLELPHNGLSIFAHRLRAMLIDPVSATFRPGRIYVRPAGNEGRHHNHMKLAVNQPEVLVVLVNRGETAFECLISSSQPGLRVSISPPAAVRHFTPPGPFAGTRLVSGHDIRVRTLPSIRPQTPLDLRADTDSHIFVQADRHIGLGASDIHLRPGIWRLRLDPGPDPHPDVHLWLGSGTIFDTQRFFDPAFGFVWAAEEDVEEPRFRRRKEWIEFTLDSEATSREAIVVGSSLFTFARQVENPARSSSRGPSTDPLVTAPDSKPDLTATGDDVVVARFRRTGNALDRSSQSAVEGGTSFASPAVAGAAALMLSHDSTLNQEDVRTILRSTATPWAQVVRQALIDREIDEGHISGKGLLNIEAAVAAVSARLGP